MNSSGGMGEFVAPADEFLVFEDGPSQDVVLQWATCRDASINAAFLGFGEGFIPHVTTCQATHRNQGGRTRVEHSAQTH